MKTHCARLTMLFVAIILHTSCGPKGPGPGVAPVASSQSPEGAASRVEPLDTATECGNNIDSVIASGGYTEVQDLLPLIQANGSYHLTRALTAGIHRDRVGVIPLESYHDSRIDSSTRIQLDYHPRTFSYRVDTKFSGLPLQSETTDRCLRKPVGFDPRSEAYAENVSMLPGGMYVPIGFARQASGGIRHRFNAIEPSAPGRLVSLGTVTREEDLRGQALNSSGQVFFLQDLDFRLQRFSAEEPMGDQSLRHRRLYSRNNGREFLVIEKHRQYDFARGYALEMSTPSWLRVHYIENPEYQVALFYNFSEGQDSLSIDQETRPIEAPAQPSTTATPTAHLK